MTLPKALKIAAAAAIVAGAAAFGVRMWRGPTGMTTEYGGTLAPRLVAEFTSTDADRWVNGAPAPLASLRGEVVFIEAWAPS
jgi:hypothetical protein